MSTLFLYICNLFSQNEGVGGQRQFGESQKIDPMLSNVENHHQGPGELIVRASKQVVGGNVSWVVNMVMDCFTYSERSLESWNGRVEMVCQVAREGRGHNGCGGRKRRRKKNCHKKDGKVERFSLSAAELFRPISRRFVLVQWLDYDMVLVLVLMILTSGEGWGRTDAVLLPRLGDRSHLEVSAWSRFKLFASNQVAFQTFFKRGF